mmetsp:Transcript_49361/g.120445  ORF Transcript_49361/g.120445 Transcript_49361/m.120445 type:complete len:214 (+) Transcript_49361:503-1144(+)
MTRRSLRGSVRSSSSRTSRPSSRGSGTASRRTSLRTSSASARTVPAASCAQHAPSAPIARATALRLALRARRISSRTRRARPLASTVPRTTTRLALAQTAPSRVSGSASLESSPLRAWLPAISAAMGCTSPSMGSRCVRSAPMARARARRGLPTSRSASPCAGTGCSPRRSSAMTATPSLGTAVIRTATSSLATCASARWGPRTRATRWCAGT